jgi:hypothetical protein
MPQLFWSHAVLIASNGSASRIGSLSGEWERFFEWELLRQGEEALLGVEEMTDNPVVSSGEASGKSGPVGGVSRSMHRLHRYGVVAMEISRRLLVTGCRTTQTAAERRGASPTPVPPGG